jgi:hypothetical protein
MLEASIPFENIPRKLADKFNGPDKKNERKLNIEEL